MPRTNLPQPVQVLTIEFDVVVAGAFDPKGLYGPRAMFVNGESVAKVDHLVLRPVNHEDGRGDFGNFVDGGKGVEAPRPLRVGEGHSHTRHQRRVKYHSAHLVRIVG